MNVLAFDTCLGALSVAVSRQDAGGAWLSHEAYETRRTGHAERLMPMIAEVMAQASLSFRDIDRIGVTLGPGSFTGVRLGIAAARGLALATKKPAVGMTSLAVMAHEARAMLGPAYRDRSLGVAVDARRGMLYMQVFDEGLRELSPLLLLSADEGACRIAHRSSVLVGSGAAVLAGAVAEAGGEAAHELPDLEPHARSLAKLAPSLATLSLVRPLYLRAPDAKPQDGTSVPRALS